MCIVIDTNCITEVFDNSHPNHHEFAPIYQWIFFGKGKIVYGGSRYLNEIPSKYSLFFIELSRAAKGVYIENELVDKEEEIVSTLIKDKNFNDQHLVALLRVSKCKLICSHDKKAYKFFKHSSFFSGSYKPKIYTSARNADLLNDSNIAPICKPASKTTKSQREIIGIPD